MFHLSGVASRIKVLKIDYQTNPGMLRNMNHEKWIDLYQQKHKKKCNRGPANMPPPQTKIKCIDL